MIILICALAQTSYGQRLFFSNLKNSTWITHENFSEENIRNLKQIALSKLTDSSKSFDKNVAVWTFHDSIITISNYNYSLEKDTLIGSYKYSVLSDPLLLEIKLDNGTIVQYKVGITSTNKHAILTLKKNIYACFNAVVDIKAATKDGIYMNGYVVNIPYEKAKKLNGKNIQIKGKVSIVSGIQDNENGIIKQGRNEDSKHIFNPKIKVLDN